MKIRSIIVAIIAVATIVVIGCQKDPSFDTTEITTKQVTSITGCSAVSGGEIIPGETPPTISKRGVCWSTSPEPTINDYTVTHPNGGFGKFTVTMDGLSKNTTYYVRAFAWNRTGAIYGEEYSFTTTELTAPTVTATTVTNVSYTSVTLGGNVTNGNGATVTERGVCWSTSINPTVNNSKQSVGGGIGTFTTYITGLTDGVTYYVRAYAINSVGTTYGEQRTITLKKFPEGCGFIPSEFSVSKNQKVVFSMGNLQYQASTNTWRFAEHQYDIIGKDNSNISSSYSGWIDMFGWGTSGWNSGANAYQPYSTSTSYSDYYPGGDYNNNLTGNYANADWGVYNKIFNGGNQAGQWRTLTYSEWNYLISGRAHASRLMGQGKVNNVNGLILLPDGWETPTSVKFTDNPSYYYSINVYSLDEWAVMESYGAVFLPAAGGRDGMGVYRDGYGYYWSSSASGGSSAYYLSFGYNVYNDMYAHGSGYRGNGRSVRLVRDAN